MIRLSIRVFLVLLYLFASPKSWAQQGQSSSITADMEALKKELDELGKDIAREPEKFNVIKVEVLGNRRVTDDDIRAQIGTRQGAIYDPTRVAQDVRALYDLGFFSDISVELKHQENGAVLVYIVKEKPAVAKVEFEGNDEVGKDDIEKVLDVKANKPLDIPAIYRNVQKIRDLYREKGFFLAQVSYRLKEHGESAFDVVFVIDEHAQVEVRRISFVGNHAITDSEIARYMATRTSGPLSMLTESGRFKREQFDRDLNMVAALYYDRGYIDVKVGTPRVELTPDRRYIFLSIPIEEGQRYRIGRVTVAEHDDNGGEVEMLGGRRSVRAMIFTQRGEWFSQTAVAEDMERVNRYYQDRGYAHVNVNPKTQIRRGEQIVDLEFDISRGPLVYFERIEVRGNSKTRDRAIRREIVIREAQKYTKTGIERSKARVTQLGFFEKVDFTTSQGSAPDKMVVNVEVTERQTGTFQVGVGFSSVENFVGQAQITEQNFMGHGQTVAIQATMSSMRQIFMLNFWEPYFLDSNWTLAFKLFNQIVGQIDYTKESTGGELTFGHSVGLRDLKLYLSYNLAFDEVNTSSANSGLLIAGKRITSSFYKLPLAYLFREGWNSNFDVTLAYDLRNNRLFPTEGSYNSLSLTWASPYIGSDFDFTNYSLASRWYLPIIWKFVLRLNLTFGVIQSNTSDGLPIIHRYKVGGIMDVRGFSPYSLGPRLSIPREFDPNAKPYVDGVNIGGNMKLVFNSEIEFPIIEAVQIKGVVFFDAGNAFNLEDTWCQASQGASTNEFTDPCNHNLLKLRTSVGLGFRWFSPMGPLRFEWGFPTTKYPGEDTYMFQFTFGTFF